MAHLARNEEQALFAEYQRTRDPKLEDRLVRSQLGLVAALAHGLSPRGADPRDLMQEGALGLLQAVRRFDPRRGVRLSTYAAWWIRAYQYHYLMRNHRLVRIGTTQAQRRIFTRLRSLRARLSAAGIEPTPERIAAILRVDADDVRSVQQRMDVRELSLDAEQSDDEGRRGPRTLPADTTAADDALAEAETSEILRQERDRMRAELDDRRRALFDARWVDEDAPTLQELGKRFGISRERTRQIERGMLDALRDRVGARLHAA